MDNGASSYRRFLNGDKKAFDEIVTAYRDSLTFFIHRYVRDLAAAEDIAIDVFTELIVYPKRYNFRTSLKTYLFMIGRSKSLDYLRHHRKFTMVDISELEEMLTDEFILEEQILADERKRLLNEAMEQLPEGMRIAIHLVYFEELSYEETARIMHKTKKQVDNLLYRGKALLRTILGKEENIFEKNE